MIVFRLTKSVYGNDLSGKGAEKYGGRWNSRGTPMIYTSQSRALCVAEIAVHTGLGILPGDFCLVQIDIHESLKVKQIELAELPENWSSYPPVLFTQLLGDKFISEKIFPVLKVPSAVIQGDYNFLISPTHEAINKIRVISVEDFNFDKRLFIK